MCQKTKSLMNIKSFKIYCVLFAFSIFCTKYAHSQNVYAQNITSWEEVSVNTFSNVISTAYKEKQSWVKSPTLWSNYLLDLTELKSFKIEYQADSVENNRKVYLTIIRDGFLDDSVRGDIYIFTIEKKVGNWAIQSIKKSTRCWRGDDSYSKKLCQ